MAISFVGTAGTIDEVIGAQRWSRIAPAVATRRGEAPRVTVVTNRTVQVSSGTLLVCGVLVQITTAESFDLDAVSSGTRTDCIVLRLTWSGLGQSSAKLMGMPAGSLRREPGVVYDTVLATAQVVPAGVVTNSIVGNVAHSGGGIRLILPTGDHNLVDAYDGTELSVESTGSAYRRVNGAWALVTDGAHTWQYFDPVLSSRTGPVTLGNGGISRGRYKLVGTRCLGEWEVRRGANGSNFGTGPLQMSLPHLSSSFAVDQWFEGHIFTWREASMDWIAHIGVPQSSRVGTIFTNTRSDDVRQRAAQSKNSSGNVGTGIPQLNKDFSDPGVVSGVFDYVIQEPS